MKLLNRTAKQTRSERGMSMIELIIAMVVLAIGILALLALITLAMKNNNRTKMDTGGNMVAQMVIETISAQWDPAQLLTITDCNNTQWIVSGQDAAAPGAGATLNASGGIDFPGQLFGAVPDRYRMLYVECGPNGQRMTYDVRWNIRTLDGYSRIVTVSARPAGAAGADNTAEAVRMFQVPVTLRTIAVEGN